MLRIIVAVVSILLAGQSYAAACDYKPSRLAGTVGSMVGTAVAGTTSAAGVGMNAAGYYTLVHSTSGLTMLGSTAAGTSGAGTVGIIGGSAGAAGTAGAVLMSPITITAGVITVVVAGGYEGICYLRVDRVTDPYAVLEVLERLAEDDENVSIINNQQGIKLLQVVTEDGTEQYVMRDLYIADGELKYRGFIRHWKRLGLNPTVGSVWFVHTEEPE